MSTRGPRSAPERGGHRSHSGAQGPAKDQLYAEVRRRSIDGRSTMNKQELREALGRQGLSAGPAPAPQPGPGAIRRAVGPTVTASSP